ncbi:MAG TPA: hypothetical protein VND95_12870 [Stellaceae bacterium]|nr:hypothetical protein [Stellaceae bacterium]
MPTTDDTAIADRDKSGSGSLRRPLRAAVLAAALCSVAACTPLKHSVTAPIGAAAPIAVEKLRAPIALAPSMTGPPAAPAATKEATIKRATIKRAIIKRSAAAAPPPIQCPLGTIGMWSPPDVVGTPVYICRQLNPPR